MTNPSLYRDDSRVRHMLDAMERISELSRGLERDQLRRHENTTEMILFNLMVLGEAANNITREFCMRNGSVLLSSLCCAMSCIAAPVAPEAAAIAIRLRVK